MPLCCLLLGYILRGLGVFGHGQPLFELVYFHLLGGILQKYGNRNLFLEMIGQFLGV